LQSRRVGLDGPEVSAIGLGCMGMSWGYGDVRNDEESVRVIHRALDLGATLIDTADVYGPFTNEELVGRALAARRADATLATKCGLVVKDARVPDIRTDGTPEHIRQACDASLRRLGVDAIDLYYLHRVDPAVPLEESVGAMAELVAAGKVRAIGLSEVSVEQLERARAVHEIAAVQMELSLWTRDPLRDVVPWCAAHGVSVVAFSPLGRGFLTGTLRSVDALASEDWRRNLPRFQADALEENLAIADRVREVADRLGATAAQVALAWVLAQGEHVIPIPGTKRLAYLEENLGAADLRLTDEDLAELDALPEPTGARYGAGAIRARE
jgi:aryl-alcohol dehydrogenase-like predicted oxidoreductase